MILINICVLPFAILIILVYLLLNNGARLYYKPNLIFGSTISGLNKWRLRYYNEPPHKFQERFTAIDIQFNHHTRSFYYQRIIKSINEICIFLLGSIFIILVGLSFISTEFVYLGVFNDKNILWFIGLLGSILVIYHNNTSSGDTTRLDAEQQKCAALTLLSLDSGSVLSSNRNKIIAASYILNIRNVIAEIATIICMPWILYRIRCSILRNKEMYKILDYHPILGMMCKYAQFADGQFMMDDMHMLLAYHNFRETYPECSLGVVLDWNNSNVRKISEITNNFV